VLVHGEKELVALGVMLVLFACGGDTVMGPSTTRDPVADEGAGVAADGRTQRVLGQPTPRTPRPSPAPTPTPTPTPTPESWCNLTVTGVHNPCEFKITLNTEWRGYEITGENTWVFDHIEVTYLPQEGDHDSDVLKKTYGLPWSQAYVTYDTPPYFNGTHQYSVGSATCQDSQDATDEYEGHHGAHGRLRVHFTVHHTNDPGSPVLCEKTVDISYSDADLLDGGSTGCGYHPPAWGDRR
jgi:hypothetical protein